MNFINKVSLSYSWFNFYFELIPKIRIYILSLCFIDFCYLLCSYTSGLKLNPTWVLASKFQPETTLLYILLYHFFIKDNVQRFFLCILIWNPNQTCSTMFSNFAFNLHLRFEIQNKHAIHCSLTFRFNINLCTMNTISKIVN